LLKLAKCTISENFAKNAQQIKETCSALCFVYKDAEKSFLMVKIAMLTSMTLDVDSQVSHMHSWDSW